jgi:hypothetical protein
VALMKWGCFLLAGILAGCGVWSANTPVPERLYSYDREAVLAAVNSQGLVYTSLFDVRRSASGTMLFVRPSRQSAYFVFAAGRTGIPEIVDVPASSAWLGEDGQLVAWVDEGGRICFRDGTVRESGRGVEGRGVQAGYYYESNPVQRSAVIFDAQSPDTALVSYKTDNIIEGIAVRNHEIWVLEVNRRKGEYLYRIFAQGDACYDQVSQIDLPFGKWVEDVDTRSGLALLREFRDLLRPRWYLFNLKSGKLVRLGAIDLGIPRFLDSDILGTDRLAAYKDDR